MEQGADAVARCTSLALAPLPLIFSYKSEKSLCGTGRFKYNMTTGRTDKLNYRIEFPQELDMSPYTEEHIMAARDGAPH